MKKIYFFIFVFQIFSLISFAQGLLLNEDFDLDANSNLNGQNSWTLGTASSNRINIVSPGLSYSDYPSSSVGNAAYLSPTTDRIQKNFTGPLSGSYFYSYLINVNSAGSGDFFIGLYSNGAFRGRCYIKADGEGFQFGLTKTTTGPVVYTANSPYSFGETYLVVVKYEFLTGSGTDDKVSLFINPNLTSETPGDPTIGPLSDNGNDVTANTIAIQGRTNSGNFTLDGIRIASDWNSIKGLPSTNHFIELPKFISSNMVLQREAPLKLWGWGVENDSIKVTLDRQGIFYSDTATVDENGKWNLELPSQPISREPCTLTFSIINSPSVIQKLENILIGDVWFAGGQSNMEKKVNHLLESAQFILEADNYPLIRSFRASYYPSLTPQEKVNGSSAPWFVCNSSNVGDLVSAVAYVYSRELNTKLNIPIGILQSYRGGTELETWMSRDKIVSDPELCKVAGRIANSDPTNANLYPSINYNGQINPLKEFPIKGFIFYQGESNTKRALEYRLMMKKIIEDWRSQWNMGDLPFYYVQLFNMGVSSNQTYEEGNWQDIREQQELILTAENIPNIGMAVSIDTNEDPNNPDDLIRIHPKNKKPVGERLAKIALKNTYDQNIIGESPVLSRYEFSNDSAYLFFKNIGSGLKIKDGETELKGFVIAGEDKVFQDGNAKIMNDSTIVLKNLMVSNPVSVRYGWAKNPICNLYNSDNLPASPFRTDIWKSGYIYSSFTSTCPPSNDANLLTIKINGVKLENFNPQISQYSVVSDKLPMVTAYANSPFAEVSIIQASEGNGKKAIITVIAENNEKKIYEILFNSNTSINPQALDNITVKVLDRKIIIENKSFLEGQVCLFDSIGRNIKNLIINPLTNSEINISHKGVFNGYIQTKEGKKKFKFVI